MNKTVVHFYLFCILYIQIKGTKLSVSREVHNAFQTYFNPIEVGTNSSLEVKFIIIFPGERFVGKYDFTTRNHSHAQWTGNFLITHNDYVNEKHVNFKQSQFKSVFIDGKVYVDSLSFDPKIAFLQDFLLKGPQIQSMMDQLMKHTGRKTYTKHANSCDYVFTKHFDDNMGRKSYFSFKQREGKYYFRFTDSSMEVGEIYATANVIVHERLNDQLFKISDNMKPYSKIMLHNQRLFLGVWNLMKID